MDGDRGENWKVVGGFSVTRSRILRCKLRNPGSHEPLETSRSFCSWRQGLLQWGLPVPSLPSILGWEGGQGGNTQGPGVRVTTFSPAPGLLNFTMNDRHTGPAWNVLMWTLLFLGQGIQVSLYCQEWYARRHCPLPQVREHGLTSFPASRIHPTASHCCSQFNTQGQGEGPVVLMSWMHLGGSPEVTSFTIHPSLVQTTFWGMLTPRSWSCHT